MLNTVLELDRIDYEENLNDLRGFVYLFDLLSNNYNPNLSENQIEAWEYLLYLCRDSLNQIVSSFEIDYNKSRNNIVNDVNN